MNLAGNKSAAKNITKTKDAWPLFLIDVILVDSTNVEIGKQFKKYTGYQEEEYGVTYLCQVCVICENLFIDGVKNLNWTFLLTGVFKINDMNTKEIFEKLTSDDSQS